jgi:hypothetical protein
MIPLAEAAYAVMNQPGVVPQLKEAAIKAFDDKLAKLGYEGEHDGKRSHHKDAADKKAPE